MRPLRSLAAVCAALALAVPALAGARDVRVISAKRQNLLKWSEAFDVATSGTTWTPGASVTVTADTTVAPDGAQTADTLAFGASGSVNLEYKNLVLTQGSAYAAALHLKRVNGAWYRLLIYDGAGTNLVRAWFNIQTGAVGTVNTAGTASGAVASITPAAGGFYRIALGGIVNWATTYRVLLTPVTADNGTEGAYNTSVVVWGASLNNGFTARRYVKTEATERP